MSSGQEWEKGLRLESANLIAEYLKECRDARLVPHIIWKGELELVQPGWIGKRRKRSYYVLAGWALPDNDAIWILENGACCLWEAGELGYYTVEQLDFITLRLVTESLYSHLINTPSPRPRTTLHFEKPVPTTSEATQWEPTKTQKFTAAELPAGLA